MPTSRSVSTRSGHRRPWSTKHHLRLVNRIGRWLERAGVRDTNVRTELAIDLADGLYAAGVVKLELQSLLRLDPRRVDGRDKALTHAVHLGVYAKDELRYHFARLLRRWEAEVEYRLARKPRRGSR